MLPDLLCRVGQPRVKTDSHMSVLNGSCGFEDIFHEISPLKLNVFTQYADVQIDAD